MSVLMAGSLLILCLQYFILQIPQDVTGRVQIDIVYVNDFCRGRSEIKQSWRLN